MIEEKYLFGSREHPADAWVVERFFDEMYNNGQERFIWVVSLIASRRGFVDDDSSCNFPDWTSFFEEDHFVGVQFGVYRPSPFAREVLVTDDECRRFLLEACRRFVCLHPEHAGAIESALSTPPVPEGPEP